MPADLDKLFDFDRFSQERREELMLKGLLYEMQYYPTIEHETMISWNRIAVELHRRRTAKQAEATRRALG